MDIFITWSGQRSLAVAEALREYLPMIVNAFNPWLSKTSIDKGANWATELTNALADASAGIICLTPSNLTEPWILFEAGAIAKTVKEKPLACTLLIDLKSSDLTSPLSLFQDTKLTQADLLVLVKTLNKALGKDALKETQLEEAFKLVWPKIEERLHNLPPDESAARPHRDQRELLEEILDTVRTSSQIGSMLVQISDAIGDIAARVTVLTPRVQYNFEGLPGLPRPSDSTLSKILASGQPRLRGLNAGSSSFPGTQSNQPTAPRHHAVPRRRKPPDQKG